MSKRINPKYGEELRFPELLDLYVEVGDSAPLTEQARQLFELWKGLYAPRATYSPVRERRLIKGLKEFGFEACVLAIKGMQHSDWHMGKNKAGQKYTEVRVALRNEDSVLRFSELAKEHNNEPGAWDF